MISASLKVKIGTYSHHIGHIWRSLGKTILPTSPRTHSHRVRTRSTNICRKGFIPSRPQAGAAWEGQVSERPGATSHPLGADRTPLNYSGAMCTPPAFNFDREKNKIGRVGPVLAPSIQIRAARTLVPRLYFRPVSITYSFFFLSFAPGDALTLIFKYPHPRRPRCFNSPIESEGCM